MWRTGLVAPRHVGSSRTRARTRVPCIGRRILNRCATGEVPHSFFITISLGPFQKQLEVFFLTKAHCCVPSFLLCPSPTLHPDVVVLGLIRPAFPVGLSSLLDHGALGEQHLTHFQTPAGARVSEEKVETRLASLKSPSAADSGSQIRG